MLKPICLVTGATEGIGRATAIGLAAKGFTVVLAARDEARAEAVKSEIGSKTGNRDIDTIVADLRSFAQVRQLCETFHRRYPRLDVLINNAGILAGERPLTGDGFEATLQVNYLSAFYLTQLMLDALKRAEQGRIINLSSSVYAVGKFDPEHLDRGRRFPAFSSYANSKLLMLLFSIELAGRLKDTPVTANAIHPGIVKTPMMLKCTRLLPCGGLSRDAVRDFAATGGRDLAPSGVIAGREEYVRKIFHAQPGNEFQDRVQHAAKSRAVMEAQHAVGWAR